MLVPAVLVAFAGAIGIATQAYIYKHILRKSLYRLCVLAGLLAGLCVVLPLRPEHTQWLANSLDSAPWWRFRAALRVSGLFILMGVQFVAASTVFDRLRYRGQREALRGLLAGAPGVLAAAGVAALLLLLFRGRAIDDPDYGALAPGGLGTAAAVGLVALLGIHAAGVCRVLRAKGLDRIASMVVAIIPSAAAVILGFWLAGHATSPGPDSTPLRALLGGIDPKPGLPFVCALWTGLYLGTVLLLAVAAYIGMRLTPRPRRRRRRPTTTQPPPIPTAAQDGGDDRSASAQARSTGAGTAWGPRARPRSAGRPTYAAPTLRGGGGHRDTTSRASLETGGRPLTPALLVFLFAVLTLWALLYPFGPGERPEAGASSAAADDWTDILSNLVLFVPLGVAAGWLARTLRFGVAASVAMAVAGGVLLSSTGEWLQSFLPERSPSWIDIVSNGLGVAAGAWAGWRTALRLAAVRRRIIRLAHRTAGGWYVLAGLLAYVVLRTCPFDLSLQKYYMRVGWQNTIEAGWPLSACWHAYTSGESWPDAAREELWRGGGGFAMALIATHLLLSVASAMSDRASRLRGRAMAACCLLVLGTELLQWPVRSRLMDLTDVACGLAAVATALAVEASWLTARRIALAQAARSRHNRRARRKRRGTRPRH